MYFKEKRPWMLPPEPVGEERITGAETADVVVVGAGYAGIFAARAANELGASVILLEKCPKEKRRVNFLGGSEFAAFNSKYGMERGVPEYDPEDYILEFQKRSLNRCNTDLIGQHAYTAGASFDWFMEPLPQHFKEHTTIFNFPGTDLFSGSTNGYKSFAGTILFDKPPASGTNAESEHNLVSAMLWTLDMIEARGVCVRYGTAAEQLEKTGDRVTAVIAKDSGGEYRRFRANKGVILAAGDFSRNMDMVLDLLDEYAEISQNGEKHCIFGGGRDGSGIRMGIWAGGRIEPGPRGGMYTCQTGRGGPMAGVPFLRLNVNGRRYTNEGIAGAFISGTRGSRQPDGVISTVWDSNWRACLRYQSYDHGALDYFSSRSNRENVEKAIQTALDEMEVRKSGARTAREEAKPATLAPPRSYPTYAAETLEELAELLGYEGGARESFLKSVGRYNELCRKGRDEDFAKDRQYLWEIAKPPFFGAQVLKDAGMLMVSEAGLVVGENQQVLDGAGRPIPGLFATGQCAGEIFPVQYCPPLSGSGIGTCTALGRLAGLHVAGL